MTKMACPVCGASLQAQLSCFHCGWSSAQSSADGALPPGTEIRSPYRVISVLGRGGFGITYLGWDEHLAIQVAIKEYFPDQWCRRDTITGEVRVNSVRDAAQFERGLSGFLDEARTLARFQQHPGIVSVLSFFRSLGTGYMVMEYVEGETLKSYVRRQGPQNWPATLDIFMHVMDSLRAVHQANVLHRDVAPDNIYLCRDGRIKLLDFGAAGRGTSTDDVVQLKPGFAAPEQYHDDGREGPWSDVYGVAASMYYCLTGKAPAPDAVSVLPIKFPSQWPQAAEAALIGALAADYSRRPQTMIELQRQLSILIPDEGRSRSRVSPAVDVPPYMPDIRRIAWSGRSLSVAAAIGAIVLLLLVGNDDAPTQAKSVPIPTHTVTPDIEPAQQSMAPDTADVNIDWAEQRRKEREAADALQRLQAEALQRFDERERQEAQAAEREQARTSSENLRRLCDEWGATMDCPKTRRP